jgi:hypothetical protein
MPDTAEPSYNGPEANPQIDDQTASDAGPIDDSLPDQGPLNQSDDTQPGPNS